MADWWQLTQGGSKVRHQSSLCWNATVNQTIVGGVCDITQRSSEIGSIWERGNDLIRFFFLFTGWIFIITGWLWTHCKHTFKFKQLVKVHVATEDPFKKQQFYHLVAEEYNIAIQYLGIFFYNSHGAALTTSLCATECFCVCNVGLERFLELLE